MEQRKALDLQAASLMVFLCMIWGAQQVILKMAAVDISPMMQIALRSGVAALLVYPLIRFQAGTHILSQHYLLPGIWLAVLFSAEFVLLSEALRFTTASHSVVLMYTAPIFVALGLHWKLASEKLAPLQWMGIGLAFMGIVVSFLGREPHADLPHMLWGDLLSLGAGILWAATTISLRLSQLAEAPATQTLFYQLVGAFTFLTPIAYLLGQHQIHWSTFAIASMGFHIFIMAFFSLMMWFWLLRHYLANGLGVFTFLTPIFGMVFGIIFLNEQIETNFIWGTILVLLGVLIVNTQAKRT